MTLQYADRVQETFTTTGTGTLSLAGAVVGYQAFSAICSNADTCYYSATDGTNWEVGIGTYTTSGDTLARTTILSSSNSGTAVNWLAGTKNIWLTLPAAQVAQSFLGFRNRLINGDMRIDQRNSGASQTFTAGSPAYAVDRWLVGSTGANVTGQRVAGTGFDQYNYQITGAASVTGITVAQRIEATNIYDLAGQTVTLSVKLADSALATVTWTANYANSADNFGAKTQIATGTFSVNSAITKYVATFALPSGAQNGVEIVLSVGAQVSGTFTVGRVQLEAGMIDTPFERRPISYELPQCQRYYETGFGSGVSYNSSGAAVQYLPVYFKTTKRVAPTVVCAIVSGSATTPTAVTVDTCQAAVNFACASSGITAYISYTASAEL